VHVWHLVPFRGRCNGFSAEKLWCEDPHLEHVKPPHPRVVPQHYVELHVLQHPRGGQPFLPLPPPHTHTLKTFPKKVWGHTPSCSLGVSPRCGRHTQSCSLGVSPRRGAMRRLAASGLARGVGSTRSLAASGLARGVGPHAVLQPRGQPEVVPHPSALAETTQLSPDKASRRGSGSGPKLVRQKDLCHTQVRPGGARGLFCQSRVRPSSGHLVIWPFWGPLLQSGSKHLIRCGPGGTALPLPPSAPSTPRSKCGARTCTSSCSPGLSRRYCPTSVSDGP